MPNLIELDDEQQGSHMQQMRQLQSDPLPPGWVLRYDPKTNRPFYVDTSSGTSSWEDPRGSSLPKYSTTDTKSSVSHSDESYARRIAQLQSDEAFAKKLQAEEERGSMEASRPSNMANRIGTYQPPSHPPPAHAPPPQQYAPPPQQQYAPPPPQQQYTGPTMVPQTQPQQVIMQQQPATTVIVERGGYGPGFIGGPGFVGPMGYGGVGVPYGPYGPYGYDPLLPLGVGMAAGVAASGLLYGGYGGFGYGGFGYGYGGFGYGYDCW
ncbi:hypothetical protein HDU67_006868 [Dinochytrium kinnereticum]|nr:hypothetical protein HDU67_006868 [Dinochytrium kinnereticum]